MTSTTGTEHLRRQRLRITTRRVYDLSVKAAIGCIAAGTAAELLGAPAVYQIAGGLTAIAIAVGLAGVAVAYVDALAWAYAAVTVAAVALAFIVDPGWSGTWQLASAPALAVSIIALNVRLDHLDRVEGSR